MLDGFLASNPNTEQLGCDNMSVMLIELNKNAFWCIYLKNSSFIYHYIAI